MTVTGPLEVLLRGPVPKLKSAELELVAFHGGGKGGGGERKRGRVGGRRWGDLWLVSRKGDEDFGDGRRKGGLEELVSGRRHKREKGTYYDRGRTRTWNRSRFLRRLLRYLNHRRYNFLDIRVTDGLGGLRRRTLGSGRHGFLDAGGALYLLGNKRTSNLHSLAASTRRANGRAVFPSAHKVCRSATITLLKQLALV